MTVPEETATVLEIRLELELPDTIHEGVSILILGAEASWADATHGEGTYAVGPTDVELLDVGCRRRIAIGVDGARSYTGGDRLIAINTPGVAHIQRCLDELSERHTEELLRLAVGTTREALHGIDDVPCLADLAEELQEVRALLGLMRVGEVVGELRDELIAQREAEGGILLEELVEACRRTCQLGVA